MESIKSSLDEAVANREQANLDTVIRTAGQKPSAVPRQGIKEARHDTTVVTMTTGRIGTRILVITTDTSLLNQATTSLDGYTSLSEVFDEVHVLVIRTGITARTPVMRVADNVWLYVATAPSRLSTPFAAWQLIKEQFVFADGFRPDLIVARDPFESALLAYRAGHVYDRPIQLHMAQYCRDVKVPKFYTRWERMLAAWLIPKFASIRTMTKEDGDQIKAWWPQVPDIATLPRYRSVSSLAKQERTTWLSQKYPQFTFVILYIGDLGYDSTAFRAIDAARAALHNPRVGMIIIGDGPAQSEFIKRTKLLGISEQVVFEKRVDDSNTYLLSADVLIVTDTTLEGDDWCIAAAAAKLPLVATTTTTRTDLFVSGETALLAEATDTVTLERSINQVLNDSTLRLRLREAASFSVLAHVHDNPEEYKLAYRASVEAAITASGPTATSVAMA